MDTQLSKGKKPSRKPHPGGPKPKKRTKSRLV